MENTCKIVNEYPSGDYPKGQFMIYDNTMARETGEELRFNDRIRKERLESLRIAAEVHRRVRSNLQSVIKPGMKMVDICETVENGTLQWLSGSSMKAGIGFPTGCSLNNCAAHYTPNPGDETTLGEDDVCKIDFGTHVKGHIIDSAFTVTFNPKYDPLKEAVKAATWQGIKSSGVDARLGEIGADIEEVMESHEIELDGKTYQVKCIENLCGHSIEPYRIHGGKTVPAVETDDRTKMEVGEVFAIETFGSTGKGRIVSAPDCSHYMKNPYGFKSPRTEKARKLMKSLHKAFGTLPFCKRYMVSAGIKDYEEALESLVKSDIIEPYPPLVDIKGSYTAQYEHTIMIGESGKEILSKGNDY